MKYKVGDKVRIVSTYYGHGFRIGEEVILTEFVEEEEAFMASNENGDWYVTEKDVEPIIDWQSIAEQLAENLAEAINKVVALKEVDGIYWDIVSDSEQFLELKKVLVKSTSSLEMYKKAKQCFLKAIDIPHIIDKYDIQDKDLIEYVFSTYDYATLDEYATKAFYHLYTEQDWCIAKNEVYNNGFSDGEDSFDVSDAMDMLEDGGYLVFKDEDDVVQYVQDEGLLNEVVAKNEFIVEIDTPLYKTILQEALEKYLKDKGVLKLINLLESGL